MKKILVTGASGQLGQCLQKISDQYLELEFTFLNSKQLDITSTLAVNTTFSSNHFDYCINCAAYTNVEQAEKTPEKAFKVNAEGVRNLALACKKNKVILIHISTDYVFDGEKEDGYLPSDLPNPINEYGKSKLRGEKYIQEILDDYMIIRTSWLYSEFGNNFYKTILQKAISHENIHVTDSQIGCPTDAANLATYLLNLIENDLNEYGILHFSNGEAMTWFDFAKKILIEHDLHNKVKLFRDKKYRTFVRRPVNSVLI